MERMCEGLQRRARRMQENIQQSVGLSGKKDELQSISHIEQRNQKIISAIKNTRQNLQSYIRSVNREETIDKRKRRLDEFGLWQQLLTDAKELENVYPRTEPSVLADIMKLFADAVGVILEERVLTDQLIEKGVLDALGKYVDDDKALSKAKEKLTRTAVDVEVSRKRKLGNHDESKAQEIQDEYDALQLKLEYYKDNIFTDIFLLLSREAEIAGVYKELIIAQMEYHRTALQKLENILPEVDRKIASYPKRPVFGCHLEDHLRCSNRSVALVLEVCCSILKYQGFQEKGLFRVSGNNNRIKRFKAAFDAHQINNSSLEITEYISDPHSVCSVLKCYLRELPEPLMTHSLHSEWVKIAKKDPDFRKEAIYRLLPSLPEANLYNLAYLIKFLQLMLNFEEHTKMGVGNLSIVFGPNLIDGGSGAESENILGSKLVETLILNADFFFPNYDFNYTSPMLDTLPQKKLNGTKVLSDRDHIVIRGNQREYPVERHSQNSLKTKNASHLRSTTSSVQSSTTTSTLRTRPKWPAPPPPCPSHTNSNNNNCAPNISNPCRNNCNNSVEDISSSLENLSNIISKSPSVASNDSMAEYGSPTNVKVCDDFSAQQQVTQSYHESDRPTRPPPPRNVRRSSTPDEGLQTPLLDSADQCGSYDFLKSLHYNSSLNLTSAQNSADIIQKSAPLAIMKDNRTVVHLDTEVSHQYSASTSAFESSNALPKPPLPYKPKLIIDLQKPNETTKL